MNVGVGSFEDPMRLDGDDDPYYSFDSVPLERIRLARSEYGHDVSIGVPAKIGASGVEEVVEWELDQRETAMFDESAEKLRDLVS